MNVSLSVIKKKNKETKWIKWKWNDKENETISETKGDRIVDLTSRSTFGGKAEGKAH